MNSGFQWEWCPPDTGTELMPMHTLQHREGWSASSAVDAALSDCRNSSRAE